ncbi:MAG TPA: helix-turn-helix transcriptional regulator [Flexivirga sp.]|uniref:AraC family transcriptional regulator n=1 Tax=Flexivirga sp. TaxID=1962927 RepID=UPI002C2B9EA9|nr:helix-turn-helix transcriptional regulator [Flexivirga sp.]HWC22754.1 helix-turn-helix transcriptional regulator [Flexivirga sp.]
MPIAPTHTVLQSGGDVIDRHQHDEHQLIYVSSGVVAIRTEHGAWVASNDRALWIPARTWHEHRFYGATNFHTIGFDTEHAWLPTDSPTVIVVDPLLRELLVALTVDDLPARQAQHIRVVVADRLHRAAQRPFMLPAPSDPRLADACRRVEADLSIPRSVGWLATQVNTGERTLSRLFRSEFGMTYPQWRTRTRLFTAIVLLSQGETVTRTAHATGWATTSAFVDTFTRALGATPGSYRHR